MLIFIPKNKVDTVGENLKYREAPTNLYDRYPGKMYILQQFH